MVGFANRSTSQPVNELTNNGNTLTNELERYLALKVLSKITRLGVAFIAALLWAALLPAMAAAQTTQPAPAASAPAATTAPAQMAFPTYGVSLAAPVGFVRIPEGTPGQMARWVRAKDGQVVTVVSAEAEPAAGRTLAEFAAGMVRTIPGLSTPKPVKLDEFDALEMELRIYSVRLHPVRAVVALKGKYFYLLSAFTSGNEPPPRCARPSASSSGGPRPERRSRRCRGRDSRGS